MKKEYLKKLEEELIKNNIENKDEVLEKYTKRYNFGLESGLSEEEIENRLGNPEDIIKDLKNDFKSEYKESSKETFNLIVKSVADDIIINPSNDKEIHTYLEKTDVDAYNLKNNEHDGVTMSYKKGKYFNLNRKKGILTVEIPDGVVFDDVIITTNSGKIYINKSLKANNIEVGLMSGSAEINSSLEAKIVDLHSTSANISSNLIVGKKATLSTISGKIDADFINTETLKVDTATGDVKIINTESKYKVSSLSGEVIINGKNIKTLKQKIKGVFVHES